MLKETILQNWKEAYKNKDENLMGQQPSNLTIYIRSS